jgi:phosphoribosylformylglycinamidine synthase
MVRAATVVRPGADAAVVALPDFSRGIAMTTDGNGRYVYLNPRLGGMHAVAEAARNLICVGARPLAVTDCLNYGNPEKPGIFYQFVESIAGISDACRVLGTPVVSGNVSFYNETNGQDIFPTPIIGMVGVVDDLKHLTTPDLKAAGNYLVLLGAEEATTLGGSEYAAMRSGKALGPTPPIDPEQEARVQAACLKLVQAGFVRAAHDVSDGGLAVALAEMCIAGGKGAAIAVETEARAETVLFGEGASRILLEVADGNDALLDRIVEKHGVDYRVLGPVTDDDQLRIKLLYYQQQQETVLSLSVTALKEQWEGALQWAMR